MSCLLHFLVKISVDGLQRTGRRMCFLTAQITWAAEVGRNEVKDKLQIVIHCSPSLRPEQKWSRAEKASAAYRSLFSPPWCVSYFEFAVSTAGMGASCAVSCCRPSPARPTHTAPVIRGTTARPDHQDEDFRGIGGSERPFSVCLFTLPAALINDGRHSSDLERKVRK